MDVIDLTAERLRRRRHLVAVAEPTPSEMVKEALAKLTEAEAEARVLGIPEIFRKSSSAVDSVV